MSIGSFLHSNPPCPFYVAVLDYPLWPIWVLKDVANTSEKVTFGQVSTRYLKVRLQHFKLRLDLASSGHVERTGPDRSVQPVQPGTNRSTGPKTMQNRLAGQTGKNRSNQVDPVNPVQPGLTGFSQFFFFSQTPPFFFGSELVLLFLAQNSTVWKTWAFNTQFHVYVIQLCCIERRSKIWKKI